MITIEGIIQRVDLQQLPSRCKFGTEQEMQFFKKFTTEEGIRERIGYLNGANEIKKFPVYHIVYDDMNDEFQLNVDFFDKQNDIVNWVSNDYTLIKWTFAFKNEYVLVFPTGLRIGTVFKQNLPTICK